MQNEGIITNTLMSTVLVIIRLKRAISTSLFFEMKGYKLEYHTLIDAYDDLYHECK